ncbi:MAG TPA: hypothetical protein VJH03_11380 [Blastocatellia bacterium]|nr:hypothetical protein [Blastocatellia bacterium]
MNNLYFACTDCKIFVDAGYRWALWFLQDPGVVEPGKPVSVESVLSAEEYWNPPRTEASSWLYKEVLPSVRRFLIEHRRHRVVFGNTSDFLSAGEAVFDWMQVGSSLQLLPRYFVERLGLVTWDEVCREVANQDATPWWWMLEWDGLHEKARGKFEELVRSSRPICFSPTSEVLK